VATRGSDGVQCYRCVHACRGDDGTERNKVKRFDVIAIDRPQPDAFARADVGEDEPPTDLPNTNRLKGKAVGGTSTGLPSKDAEATEFAFGANVSGNGEGPYREGR